MQMKLFDLYTRIIKKQAWLYGIYIIVFFAVTLMAADAGRKTPGTAVLYYYRYAALAGMVLIMLTISAVTAVTSDTELFMRHKAAPVRMELLELTYVGADLLVMLFWWMLFFWTAVVLYGEAAYNAEGLLMAADLFVLSLFSTAVGYIIGIFAKSAQGRGIAANVMAFSLAFAGGSIFSQEQADNTVYLLRSFTPLFWYQKALDELALHPWKTENVNNFAGYIGIQIIFALMVLALGLLLEKQRKEVA